MVSTTTTLFHTSGAEITQLHGDGMFGEFLFFASKPYYMTASENPVIYTVEVESNKWGQIVDDGIIAAARLFYHDDASKLRGLVAEFCQRFGVDSEDDAEEIISERMQLRDVVEDADGEDDWEVQRFTARAAKLLGYRGVEVTDEQGCSWMLDMTHPANAPQKFSKKD